MPIKPTLQAKLAGLRRSQQTERDRFRDLLFGPAPGHPGTGATEDGPPSHTASRYDLRQCREGLRPFDPPVRLRLKDCSDERGFVAQLTNSVTVTRYMEVRR